MAPGGSSSDTDHEDVSDDTILNCIRQISSLTEGDARKMTKATTTEVRNLALQIECEYLLLRQRLERLELIEKAYFEELKQSINKDTPMQHRQPGATPTNNRKSYAAAATTPTKPQIDPKCILQVLPKKPEEMLSSEAAKQLITLLDIKGKKVGIKHMKSIKGCGVSILCREPGEVQVLRDVIQAQQGKHFVTKTVEKKNPTMTMLLPGKDWVVSDLKEDIITRNEYLEADSLNIVHNYGTQNGNTIVVLQVSPKAFQSIIQHDFKLYVGWTRASLREQDPVTQCHKCQRFGHKARACRHVVDGKPATRCARCSAHHPSGTPPCTADPCCANCKDFNVLATKRKWRTVDTNHLATAKDCPMRIKATSRARALIAYD